MFVDSRSTSLPYRSPLVILSFLVLAGACFVAHRWTGDVASSVLDLPPLLEVTAALLLAYLAIAKWNLLAPLRWVLEQGSGSDGERKRWHWPLAGFVAVCGTLLVLERFRPYYFTQDDNLAQFLPGILQGCRSLWSGVFPVWNPHQYMGSPTATVGTYALTYPLTWFSYWLARDVLHREFAVLDIFVIVHLLSAYWAIYFVIRRERCSPPLAMAASFCCTFSGFALIFCRSWFYMSPVLLWTPVMMFYVQKLRDADYRPSWHWITGFAAATGLYFHAGNIQMWTYSVALIALAALILIVTVGAAVWLRVLVVLSAMVFSIALSAPLLVPEILATANVRRGMLSAGVGGGLLGFLVPSTLTPVPHPFGWGATPRIGEMYYSGTLFILLALLLLLSVIVFRVSRQQLSRNVWVICAVVALLFALGDSAIFWNALIRVPGFDRFRSPFKFTAYIDVFGIVAGAAVAQRLVDRAGARVRGFLAAALVLVIIPVMLYHVRLSDDAFSLYGFSPFPAPNPNLLQRLEPSDSHDFVRFLPVGDARSRDPEYIDSLAHQWPSLFGLYSMGGYDPLVSEAPNVLTAFKRLNERPRESLYEFATRYVVVYGNAPRFLKQLDLPTVYRNGELSLLDAGRARPLVFEQQTGVSVDATINARGVDITDIGAHKSIVLSLLYRGEYRGFADGRSLMLRADEWGRILLDVPPGAHHIQVRFMPPWRQGWLASIVCVAAGMLLGGLATRKYPAVRESAGSRAQPTTAC